MISRIQAADIAAQIGSSLMPDNAQWTNRFTVKSTSSASVYVVAQRRTDAVWGCSCRGWTHYRHCKHLTDILRRLAKLADQIDAPTFREPKYAGNIPAANKTFDSETVQMLRSARVALLDLDTVPTQADKSRRHRAVRLDLD